MKIMGDFANRLIRESRKTSLGAKLITKVTHIVSSVSPLWVRHPLVLQLDTQNYCNLDCVYCNVKDGTNYNIPRGIMPMETIKSVLSYWRGTVMWSVAPFMNGDPLLEPRLHEINDMIHSILGVKSIIDTNGSIWKNRALLCHENLGIVRFTIAAATPETYMKVHGKDLFDDAMKTFLWFKSHKLPDQQEVLHFIVNKHNEHEIEDWIELFKGTPMRIFGLHRNPDIQKTSEVALGSDKSYINTRPLLIRSDGVRLSEPIRPNMPCQCWDILGVGHGGEILQCVDYPYKYNYGNVQSKSMLEAWHERNKNAMDNPCCAGCNVRFSNWKEIFKKFVR